MESTIKQISSSFTPCNFKNTKITIALDDAELDDLLAQLSLDSSGDLKTARKVLRSKVVQKSSRVKFADNFKQQVRKENYIRKMEERTKNPFLAGRAAKAERNCLPTSLSETTFSSLSSFYDIIISQLGILSIQDEQMACLFILALWDVYKTPTMSNILKWVITYLIQLKIVPSKILQYISTIPIPDVSPIIRSFGNIFIQYFSSPQPDQPQQAECIPTSLDMSDPSHLTLIATTLAAIPVLIGSTVLGYTAYTKKHGDYISSFVQAATELGKVKTGIYSFLVMIKDLSTQIRDFIIQSLATDEESTLAYTIRNLDIHHSYSPYQRDYFKIMYELTDPSLYQKIHSDIINYKPRIETMLSLTELILHFSADRKIELSNKQLDIIKIALKDLKSVYKTLMTHPIKSPHRKTPAWFYFTGKPGVGKSQLMTTFTDALYRSLQQYQIEKYQGLDYFELGAPENKSYCMNFCDKFMTGYRENWAVEIDDVFQDRGGSDIDTSTALKVISFVSNVQFNTNQAALEDKGLPFTSRVLITSSNIPYPNRPEVHENEAIHRRRTVVIEVVASDQPDPDYGHRVQFNLLPKLNGPALFTGLNLKQLMEYCLKAYISHWDMEVLMDSNRHLSNSFVDGLVNCLPTAGPSVITTTLRLPYEPPHDNSSFFSILSDFTNQYACKFTTAARFFLFSFFWWLGAPTWLVGYMVSFVFGKFPFDLYIRSTCRTASLPNAEDQSFNHSLMFKYIHEKVLFVYQTISDVCLVRLLRNYTPAISLITKIAAALLVLYIGYRIIGKKTNDSNIIHVTPPPESPEPTVAYSDNTPRIVSPVTLPTSVPYSNNMPKLTVNNCLPTAGLDVDDPNAYGIVNSLISKSQICKIGFPNIASSCTGVRIKGQYLLTVHHTMSRLLDGDLFEVYIQNGDDFKISKQFFSKSKMTRIPNKDACLYLCDASLPAARDITGYFLDDVNKLMPFIGLLPVVVPNKIPVVYRGAVMPVTSVVEGYTNEVGNTYYNLHYYEAAVPGLPGASGTPLVCGTSTFPSKIVGMQVCMRKSTGYAYVEPLYTSELETALKSLPSECIQTSFDEAFSIVAPINVPKPDFIKASNGLFFIGKVTSQNQIMPANKTKLAPSVIHQYVPHHREPAALHSQDPRILPEHQGIPLNYKNFEGFDRQYGAIHRDVLESATADIAREYASLREVVPRVPLTEHEMLNGTVSGRIRKMDLYTSPGFPHVKNRKNKKVPGKFEFFEQTADGLIMTPDLQENFDRYMTNAYAGVRIAKVSYACTKDELRTTAKIQQGKTRVFICLDMVVNLAIRKEFGAMIETMRSYAGEMPSSVGIDAYTEWGNLYYRLISKGTSHISGYDYTEWDKSLHPEFFNQMKEVATVFYNDRGSIHEKARSVLIDELCYSLIINNRYFFMKTGGMPSGCAVTADLNSWIHDLLVYYVWRLYWRSQPTPQAVEMQSLKSYRSHVAIATFGDDMIMSTTKEASQFNGNTIHHYFDDLGMSITSEAKDQNFTFKNANEITFLKRRFVQNQEYPKFIMAPLDKISIEDNLPWIHKCDDPELATLVQMDNALREATLWGESYYNDILLRCENAWKTYASKNPTCRKFTPISFHDSQQAMLFGKKDKLYNF